MTRLKNHFHFLLKFSSAFLKFYYIKVFRYAAGIANFYAHHKYSTDSRISANQWNQQVAIVDNKKITSNSNNFLEKSKNSSSQSRIGELVGVEISNAGSRTKVTLDLFRWQMCGA